MEAEYQRRTPREPTAVFAPVVDPRQRGLWTSTGRGATPLFWASRTPGIRGRIPTSCCVVSGYGCGGAEWRKSQQSSCFHGATAGNSRADCVQHEALVGAILAQRRDPVRMAGHISWAGCPACGSTVLHTNRARRWVDFIWSEPERWAGSAGFRRWIHSAIREAVA